MKRKTNQPIRYSINLIISLFILSMHFFDSYVYSQENQFYGQIAADEFGKSAIFKMDRNGSNFNLINDMVLPFYLDVNGIWALLDDKFYFTSFWGGGMLVSWDPLKRKLSKEYDFNDYLNKVYPFKILYVFDNGKMYGTTNSGGDYDRGIFFEWDAILKIFTKKMDFNPDDSIYSFESMMKSENGKFYVVSYNAIVEWDSSTNVYKNIHYFNKPFWDIDGDVPKGKLVQAANGKIYGVCEQGGQYNKGAIFEIDPFTSVYTKKIDFQDYVTGVNPNCTLVEADNYKLYGVTGYSDDGSHLFEYDPETNQLHSKYVFTDTLNGRFPVSSMTKGENGKLYGITCFGGINNTGVIYEWDPITDIYLKKIDFDSSMIGVTYYAAPLVQYENGNFYGRFKNNKGGRAVIFKWDVTNNCINNEIMSYDYMTGQHIYRDLTMADNGKIYGVSSNGGSYDFGTLFELDPIENSSTIKKEFYYSNAGSHPFGSLLKATNGKMYGMSSGMGSYNLSDGSIFEWNPKRSQLLKKFDFEVSKGNHPKGSLIEASNGKFYGMTQSGGANDKGVIFEWDPVSEAYSKKFDFDSVKGQNPVGNLIQSNDGKLYGMTPNGGANKKGVIFEWDIDSNIYTTCIDFNGINGKFPDGDLIKAGNGKLYGTTTFGGIYLGGVLFEFDPLTKAYTVKVNFDDIEKGAMPGGSLIQSSNGKLYGVTMEGGTYDKGVLFSWDPETEIFNKVIDFDGLEKGSAPYGRLVEISNAAYDTINVNACFNYTTPSGKYKFTKSGVYKDFLTSQSGIDSVITINLTISKSSSSTIQTKACGSYTSPSGKYTWDKSGTYLDTIPNAMGCDSIMIIELNVISVDPTLTFLLDEYLTEIVSNDTLAHHQWVDCNNNYKSLAGKTGQSFKPTESGNYAVVVTYGWCSDTSECVPVNFTGIEPTPLQNDISIYPNPTNGKFTVNLGSEYEDATITISELDGRIIETKKVRGEQRIEMELNSHPGVYLLTIMTKNKTEVIKIINQLAH